MSLRSFSLRPAAFALLIVAGGAVAFACGGDDKSAATPTAASGAAKSPEATKAAETPSPSATVKSTETARPADTATARPTETAKPADTPKPATAAAVTISDNRYTPATLTVAAGTKVTWTWSGNNPHSVTGKFNGQDVLSPTRQGSGSFDFTFDKAGTFAYQCGIHGAAMTATIVVQ